MSDEVQRIRLSSLGHTWVLDLDGTIVKHNGYLIDGHDTLLPGVKGFMQGLPAEDAVVFITSRSEEYREETIGFLADEGIHYNAIVFGAPYGERILVNDAKPSGLNTSVAVSIDRDSAWEIDVSIDETL